VKKIAVFLIYILAYNISFSGLVYAGIGVQPTITEITVKPGSVTKGVFKVANSDEKTLRVTVEIEDWLKKRAGKDSGIDIGQWLKVTPMEFDIEPQQVKEIEYILTPPANARGELIAMIFFGAEVPMQGAMGITARFGVSIYAAMENTMDIQCEITGIKVERNIAKEDTGGTVDRGIVFVLDLVNNGNVHTRPTGSITVSDEKGNPIAGITIERNFPVFPGQNLSYAIRWDKTDLPEGKYEALVRLDYGKIYNKSQIIEKKKSFAVDRDGMISF